MDIRDLKKQADLSYDISVAKSNALEKALSRQQFAYEGHLFMANAETICLVKTLKELQQSPFYILDVNQNPVEIKDPDEFLDMLVKRNQETLNNYNNLYKELQKKI